MKKTPKAKRGLYYNINKRRKAGFKIHGAPWVRLGHFGSYLFEGGPIPAP